MNSLEEYAEEYYYKNYPATLNIGEEGRKKEVTDIYIAGFKAGKPKWHKVADGDYPPCEKGNYSINILTDKGNIAYYNYDMECWVAEPSSAEIDPPVAWCELPTFDKE